MQNTSPILKEDTNPQSLTTIYLPINHPKEIRNFIHNNQKLKIIVSIPTTG